MTTTNDDEDNDDDDDDDGGSGVDEGNTTSPLEVSSSESRVPHR